MSKIIYRDPNVTIFQSALFQTNTTVVKTDDIVIIIDPAWLPEEVDTIRQYVESVRRDLPVYLVFTHSDYDHIIGYGAFNADKIIASQAFVDNPNKDAAVDEMLDFDEKFYITRNYKLEYPEINFTVYRDGVHLRQGHTKMAFYLAPGHTIDSMIVVVWSLGLCVAGDYLSNVEFPFIYHSSVDYENTLEKLPVIHDKNWFTRLVPGHGDPALTITDWLRRRTESLAYIYALRESIVTGIPFDEESLWQRYGYSRLQRKYHFDNIALMTREYEEGLWTWDPLYNPEEHASDPGPVEEEPDIDD
ncbi:MAG: MBL fold metallo-hydrolase [Chitinophagales bacterium]|nr:MBL fold metallo-hydrolase [Chitinophagales bacterium]